MKPGRRVAQDLKEAGVGVLVLAVVGALLLLPYREVGASGSNEILVSATFNRIDGLNVGDPVRLSGIRVGEVESAVLDPRFRAQVTMRISGGVNLPADTSASIQTDGLFGSKFLVLEPGGDDETLKAGGRIRFTQDAMIVSNLLDLIINQGRARLEREKACGGCGNSGSGTK